MEDRSLYLSISVLREKLRKKKINKVHFVNNKFPIAEHLTKNGGNTQILLHSLKDISFD